ncbi:uncharacterized protein EV422DRAFT_516368 [Fimicolochytrium jonesii]|uniref:uncharacterized protein n=1 Tax=Fimicolochytrium jonesii TaxID=1396493 RepID=UPI0022FEE7D0|nr:uncharacterized protein EV422DRAFT_516368 [Fimicolochytrium jonesii]KAI8824840.1 hypothetical protein EV422DRAFT_516368 [Fimicolochytrium jonesii]
MERERTRTTHHKPSVGLPPPQLGSGKKTGQNSAQIAFLPQTICHSPTQSASSSSQSLSVTYCTNSEQKMHTPTTLLALAALVSSTTAQLITAPATSQWTAGSTTNTKGCVANPVVGTDYFPQKTFKNGTNDVFTVAYQGNIKIVTDNGKLPYTKPHTYVLYQCGTAKPTPEFLANYPGATVFSIPLESVATTSTTELAYLEILGARNVIKYTTDQSLITSPCIHRANLTSINPYNQTAAEGAAFIAAYNNVNATISGGDLPAPSANKTLVFPAVSDQTRYGRSEWLLFLSAFFNAEDTANQAVQKIKTQYDCVSAAAKKAAETYGSPDASWADFYTPDPTKGVTQFNLGAPYKYQYLQDAGAVFAKAGAGNTGTTADKVTESSLTTTPTTSEAVKNLIANSEIFITSGFVKDNAALLASLNIAAADVAKYNITQTKEAWSADKKISPEGSGIAWFSSAVPYHHLVLADLASIVQPALLPNYVRNYFRNVATENPVGISNAQCDNAANPLMGTAEVVPDVYTGDCALNGATLTGTVTNWKTTGAGGTNGVGNGGQGNSGGRMGVSAFLTVALTVVGSAFCLL